MSEFGAETVFGDKREAAKERQPIDDATLERFLENNIKSRKGSDAYPGAVESVVRCALEAPSCVADDGTVDPGLFDDYEASRRAASWFRGWTPTDLTRLVELMEASDKETVRDIKETIMCEDRQAA
ncbi:MAG: hypothetical protein Q7S84_02965 [bacterium]|nr:hypothetical protein [bacterium]